MLSVSFLSAERAEGLSLVPRALQIARSSCSHTKPTGTRSASVPAGNLLHEVLLHDQAGPFPAEAAGGGEEGALQSPLDLLLAAVDTGAAGGGEAAGAGGGAGANEGRGVRAGIHRARRRCHAGPAPAAQVGAAAPEGEVLRLRPGR